MGRRLASAERRSRSPSFNPRRPAWGGDHTVNPCRVQCGVSIRAAPRGAATHQRYLQAVATGVSIRAAPRGAATVDQPPAIHAEDVSIRAAPRGAATSERRQHDARGPFQSAPPRVGRRPEKSDNSRRRTRFQSAPPRVGRRQDRGQLSLFGNVSIRAAPRGAATARSCIPFPCASFQSAPPRVGRRLEA